MVRAVKRDGRIVPATLFVLLLLCRALSAPAWGADVTVELNNLIAEALRNSPEIRAAEARAQAAGYRIPQAGSLPDPMLMLGYQNEGFQKITIGEEIQAMGMSSLSQTFPFPGKRGLRAEVATRDAESARALYNVARHRVVAQVRTLFYDLFLAYKNIDILNNRSALFSRIEDAAAARYSSGTGSQQEIIMAQTEKYLIDEREEMQRQRVQALAGMLNSTVGRDADSPLGRPADPQATPFTMTLQETTKMAESHSPDVRSKEKMVEAAEAKVKVAKKDYYPDITLLGSYFPRTRGFLDMWNVTATVNLPIYFRTKQRQAVLEAEAGLSEARRELTVTRLALSSSIRESFSLVQAADRLMKLYREGLIPKTNQDVQLSIAGYVAGRTDALTVITRIKNLLDYDVLFWSQFAEREKAIARLHALTGTNAFEETGQVRRDAAAATIGEGRQP